MKVFLIVVKIVSYNEIWAIYNERANLWGAKGETKGQLLDRWEDIFGAVEVLTTLEGVFSSAEAVAKISEMQI